MNRVQFETLVVTLFVILFIGGGCIPAEQCPREDTRTPYLQESIEAEFKRARGHSSLHPFELTLENELYLRIVSDTEVEVLYEKEGEVVVESYRVKERHTTPQPY